MPRNQITTTTTATALNVLRFASNTEDEEILRILQALGKVRDISTIEKVDISTSRITDEGLEVLIGHIPRLRCLDISECDNLTDKGIMFIGETCDQDKQFFLNAEGELAGLSEFVRRSLLAHNCIHSGTSNILIGATARFPSSLKELSTIIRAHLSDNVKYPMTGVILDTNTAQLSDEEDINTVERFDREKEV